MKKIHIVGGGTVAHSSCHMGLCAPAFGTTARKLKVLCDSKSQMETLLHLTAMAGGSHHIQSVEHLENLAARMIEDPDTKIVFWSPAVCDFTLKVNAGLREGDPKYSGRLDSRQSYGSELVPQENKVVRMFRRERKDITLVAFKTTCGATEDEQYLAGLNLLKSASCNLVLANDTLHRRNMVIVPEEARYCVTTDRDQVLSELVDIALLRSTLTFTRSTVVDGSPIPWSDPRVPEALRQVVNHCVQRGAYRKFRGVTAGHFAVKIDQNTFLSSRRKTDLGDIDNVGLVKIVSDGDDSVLAFGSKPSVGGQSQRIVFAEHPSCDSVVHFHCPIRPGSGVPTVSQREFECGSHECGRNTSRGLKKFGGLLAVYLDNHGPNVVFDSREQGIAEEVISFIESNFNLDVKTGGQV